MPAIKEKLEHFNKSYVNEVLPPVFQEKKGDCDFSDSLLILSSGNLKTIISQASLTLLIATEQIKNEQLIAELQAKADSGVRIYLLLGNESDNKSAIDTLSGRCLIRTGISQKGALVLIDHATSNARGWLLMDSILFTATAQRSWSIELETKQIGDSFRSFCKLFWEHSKNEYVIQNQETNSSKHPDASIITNNSHQLSGTLSEFLSDTLANLQRAIHCPFEIKQSDARFLLNVNTDNILSQRNITLTNKPAPLFLSSKENSWLLPDNIDLKIVNWCLRLSNKQSDLLCGAFDKAWKDAKWQYAENLTIGDLTDQKNIRFADQTKFIVQVKDNRNIDLKTVQTKNIDSFLNDSAEQLCAGQLAWQRDYLAHNVDYNVTIHPPYCPKSAEIDPLYTNWKMAENDWKDRVASLVHQQQSIDKQQASIADKFKGFLKGFLLGQGQSVKKMNKDFAELELWSVTKASPAERDFHRKHLELLVEQIQDRSERTSTELNKAEQHHAWQEKRKILIDKCDKENQILKEKQYEFDNLSSNESTRLFDAKHAFSKSWHDAIGTLNEGQLEQLELPNIQLDQFLKFDVLEQLEDNQQTIELKAKEAFIEAIKTALINMDYNQAEAFKASKKEKIFKKHYKSLDKAIVDYQQSIQKIERDLKSAAENINKAQRQQESAEQVLQAHGNKFEYKKDPASQAFAQQLGLKSNKQKPLQFEWPIEDLPAVGTELKILHKQRWLVIHDTEQLDQARIDAERLNARICVNSSEES